jgi:hypothetical protein
LGAASRLPLRSGINGGSTTLNTRARRPAMISKAISISVGVLSLATSAALATGLTERMQAERMTVVQVDRSRGHFLCAEHRRWTQVAKAEVTKLAAGDIVRVEREDDQVWKVRVVRTASEELASPEM